MRALCHNSRPKMSHDRHERTQEQAAASFDGSVRAPGDRSQSFQGSCRAYVGISDSSKALMWDLTDSPVACSVRLSARPLEAEVVTQNKVCYDDGSCLRMGSMSSFWRKAEVSCAFR